MRNANLPTMMNPDVDMASLTNGNETAEEETAAADAAAAEIQRKSNITAQMEEASRKRKSHDSKAAASREKANKLRKETTRQDRETIMHERQSAEASELHGSLYFQLILPCLRLNDETTTTVDQQRNQLPRGWGKDLGQALIGNTNVTSLDLDLDDLLTDKEELEPFLTYLQKNSSLVRFGARSRPSSFLKMDPSSLLDSLTTCPHLEHLNWRLPLCPLSLGPLLSTTKTLQSLEATLFKTQDSANEREHIASAFKSNTTLQRLTLYVCDKFALSAAIVRNLNDSLRHLRLQSDRYHDNRVEVEPYVDAISECLGSTRDLERLELEDLPLNEDCLTKVMSGLRHADGIEGLPSTFVTSLSVPGCILDGNAMAPLCRFLRTKTTGIDGEILYHSKLRELCLSFVSHEEASRLPLAFSMAPESGTPVTGQGQQQVQIVVPTIGSQIQTLSVESVSPAFFQQLGRHADRVRLQSLKLNTATAADAVSLYHCIPKLTSLRELTISRLPAAGVAWIRGGLKRNCSICKVVLANENGSGSIDAVERRLIDAYCKRNQKLGLIAYDDDGARIELQPELQPELQLRPPALTASMHIPADCSAKVLSGLLSMGESLGEELIKKRPLPSSIAPKAKRYQQP